MLYQYYGAKSVLKRHGSMLSCFLVPDFDHTIQCCNGNQDSLNQSAFFKPSNVQFWWASVNLASRVFCCCPSASRFNIWCIQRFSSVWLGCNKLLLLPSSQLEAVCPLSSDLKKPDEEFTEVAVSIDVVRMMKADTLKWGMKAHNHSKVLRGVCRWFSYVCTVPC